MLKGKEKRKLRAMGNSLKAELWVGKDGISDGTLQSLENSFNTKELVKIKLQDSCPLLPREAADILSRKSDAQIVQVIGSTLLLYRELPEKD